MFQIIPKLGLGTFPFMNDTSELNIALSYIRLLNFYLNESCEVGQDLRLRRIK